KVYSRQKMLLGEGATPRLVFEKSEREFESSQTEFHSLEQSARQADDRVDGLLKDLDNAKLILEDRNNQLEGARDKLAAGEIRSPADGIVIARNGSVGDPVGTEKKTLFQIAVQPSLLEAVVEPEPPVLKRVKPGQPALIVAADLAGDPITGA